jgi:hypothetical protein
MAPAHSVQLHVPIAPVLAPQTSLLDIYLYYLITLNKLHTVGDSPSPMLIHICKYISLVVSRYVELDKAVPLR